ncbi:MAG: recombinase family protein [Gemmataceae bacterium]
MTSPTTPTGTRGVAYVRISTDQQEKASQVSNIKRWLASKGLTVRIWYEDIGSRHEAYKRPEFKLLMQAVRAGQIDWIVVDSKDRFGTKNSYEFGKFASELQDNDVELWSVAAGCLTHGDYATEIMATVDSVRSRDEQLERSRRALRAITQVWEEGRYNGAYPPYGFDVACLGADREEKWRVRYEGHSKRLKIYPDGRQERYDGPANFPSRDQADILRLVHGERQRIEVVRAIFKWWTTESITFGGIAERLNTIKADPIYAQAWYYTRVAAILKNPVYLVGRTVGNKQSHGSFFEMRGGKATPAATRRGRPLTYRLHPESDYIYPKEWGEGLVDRDTWDLAQAKLKRTHAPNRSPRSSALWLGPFLYCGHCGMRMHGWHQRTIKKNPYSYVCSTFRRYGQHNKTGCRLHRIKHSDIEQQVMKFLRISGQKLNEVLGNDTPDWLDEAVQLQGWAEQEYCRMIGMVWATIKKWGIKGERGKPWTAKTLAAAFKQHSPKHLKQDRLKLTKLQDELREHTKAYLKLPPRAQEIARQELASIEQEIEEIEDRLQPLDDKLTELRESLENARERVRDAEVACGGDGNRQKAEALAKVLARVVLTFRHYRSVPKDGRSPGKDRSEVEKIVFEPLSGPPREFRNEMVGNPKS